MTYPQPAVAEYIRERFVPLKLLINNRDHWALYRANQVIWTPTVGFMDRNGSMHYHSVGFLPPEEFLSVMKMGRARCLMAWMRSAEAAEELEVAASVDNSFTPEALYWLGIARFLVRRDSSRMWEPLDRLTSLYPASPCARRVYPRPQSEKT